MTWWQTIVHWNWGLVGKSALGAGLGATIVGGLLLFLRDHRRQRAFSTYMALRLAELLEAYAAKCAEAVSDDAHARHLSGQEVVNGRTTVPELPPYLEDHDGWHAIDATLAGQCLSFRNKIRASQSMIDGMIEHDRETLGILFRELVAELGLEAWQLAADLRHRHRIEKADVMWDCANQLRQILEEARKPSE
ncbi:hypothetical protein JAO75_16250 [Microvirga sp. BT325]|uniref:Uncharacterized protein n=2 Tax=Microvirga splendida TaxID=2795727 RepID=A0ABS0Y3S2_9HYPH|nr:hypothetical protein [Microvirga splendida]